MKKAMLSLNVIPLILAAALVAGCGTDDETFQKSDAGDTTRSAPVAATATPSAPAPPTTTEVAVAEPQQHPRIVTYEEAELAYTARRYDEALTLFTRYVEEKPDNPWGHYMLGLSAWKAGNLQTAEESLRRAAELDTTHVKSYVNLARVLIDAGRPADAYVVANHALAIDDGYADAWRVKGSACHDLDRTDEAVAAYRRAIQLHPEDAWSMNNLAYIRIQQERFDEAIGPLARAIELKSDVAAFHNNLGMALERTGHLQAAEGEYARAVSADSSYARAAANGERLAAVIPNPDETPVDLAALARAFVENIDTLSSSTVAAATGEAPLVAPAGAVPADTTTASQP